MASSGKNDFDFIIGKWNVLNKRLKERLVGSDEWIEFPATYEAWKLLGGLANVDRIHVDDFDFDGASVRTFNPQNGTWTIYWMDSTHSALKKQVAGSFQGNIGTFVGEEMYHEKLVKLRFIWKALSHNEARWEQAYYDEARGEWETNWIMEFTRAE